MPWYSSTPFRSIPVMTLLLATSAACKSREFNAPGPYKGESKGEITVQGFRSASGSRSDKALRLPSGRVVDRSFRLSAQEHGDLLSLMKQRASWFFKAPKPFPGEPLREGEHLTVELYSRNWYVYLGEYLARGKCCTTWNFRLGTEPSSEEFETVSIGLISAVNSAPRCDYPVYFGARLDNAIWEDRIKAGENFVSANFTSTSKSRKIAESFMNIDFIDDKKSSYLFKLACKSAGEISRYSTINEEEVLYTPSFPFKIKKVSQERLNGGTGDRLYFEVELEEWI